MMRLAWTLFALAACAAPQPVTEGQLPSLDLIYPDPATTESLPVDASGTLETLIVFDVQNFELVAPENNLDIVDGQGHVHAFLNDEYIPVSQRFLNVVSSDLGQVFEDGDIVQIRIDLRNNQHAPVAECDPCTQSIEVPAALVESSDEPDGGSATRRFLDWLDEQDDPRFDDFDVEGILP